MRRRGPPSSFGEGGPRHEAPGQQREGKTDATLRGAAYGGRPPATPLFRRARAGSWPDLRLLVLPDLVERAVELCLVRYDLGAYPYPPPHPQRRQLGGIARPGGSFLFQAAWLHILGPW